MAEISFSGSYCRALSLRTGYLIIGRRTPLTAGIGTSTVIVSSPLCMLTWPSLLPKIHPDQRPDETVLCTRIVCTGADVEAKFTSDKPHAVTTRCDWLLRFYLACLSMTSLQHMPRVLAIHRSMTRNVLSRRRVRYWTPTSAGPLIFMLHLQLVLGMCLDL
jgi:hypothetical protein